MTRPLTEAEDWRVRAFPIQVRVFPDEKDRTRWALYSRHKHMGATAQRAYVEAVNAHPGALVEIIDVSAGNPGRGVTR